LALAVFGFVLIKNGAYPPEGTGSLGHVGMVIAGAIAVVLALFALLCISKVELLLARIILRGRPDRFAQRSKSTSGET
jgi:hypothetical protein